MLNETKLAGAAVCVLLAATPGVSAHAGEPFRGPYLAFDATRQSIIAGADVRGVDTLAQSRRVIGSASVGYRYMFDNGLLVGAEAGLGRGDQSLRLDAPSAGLQIRYSNRSQYHFGGLLGWSPTEEHDLLVFAYVSEVKRGFDVSGMVAGVPLRQSDRQGILRYGLGVERAWANGWGLRSTIGTSRADFGNQRTNIDPKRQVEASAGVTYQF